MGNKNTVYKALLSYRITPWEMQDMLDIKNPDWFDPAEVGFYMSDDGYYHMAQTTAEYVASKLTKITKIFSSVDSLKGDHFKALVGLSGGINKLFLAFRNGIDLDEYIVEGFQNAYYDYGLEVKDSRVDAEVDFQSRTGYVLTGSGGGETQSAHVETFKATIINNLMLGLKEYSQTRTLDGCSDTLLR